MIFITTFLAFLLFVSVTSAPTGHDTCTDVRNSALEFNQIAKKAFMKRKSNGISNFTIPPAWMEAQDHCDPGTLRLTPESCVRKMLDVLTSYNSFVKTVADSGSCPDIREVVPVMEQLHANMSKCVRMERMEDHQSGLKVVAISEKPIELWEDLLLCNYTIERLFSFSILTARVFSVGDPSNHAEPTDSPNCAQKNV